MSEKKYAVIVDPTSSGSLIAPELKKRGFECIAVHGRPLPPALIASYLPENFCSEYYLNDDYDGLKEKLAAYKPQCVMAGNEPGVDIADRLVHDFGLPGNDFELSEARTNKYFMQERIREVGLRAIAQQKSDDLNVLLTWLDEHGRYPVVVKPLNSGGTDGVVVCSSKDMVVESYNAIMKTKNLFGIDNNEVLIQEYIEGTEYIVDQVSCQGQHIVVDVIEYEKYIGRTGAPVYRRADQIREETQHHQQMIDYNKRVLDALGIVNGSSHSEIMMTNEGPVLIEIGARMAGANFPALVADCARFSQLDLAVDVAVDPEQFFGKMKQGQRFHKGLCVYFLSSTQRGLISEVPGRSEIENLSSHWRSLWRAEPGKQLEFTSDLISSPAFIYLANEDLDQLDKDIARIGYLEKNNLIIDIAEEAVTA